MKKYIWINFSSIYCVEFNLRKVIIGQFSGSQTAFFVGQIANLPGIKLVSGTRDSDKLTICPTISDRHYYYNVKLKRLIKLEIQIGNL
jgi:hypothetical protein